MEFNNVFKENRHSFMKAIYNALAKKNKFNINADRKSRSIDEGSVPGMCIWSILLIQFD